ncbi:hypothetical protein ACVC7V_20455 [Hydrogenophaga sp. A37]|uniref:hypothetical protein n=1 Tax=Hydrogenophaga sp. A37 TaxID=1945864 RepID=UPI000984DDC5|nr:hypothetical protein [Hydrogenophaga sp. A37]OOG83138.1 hypothetical protein B0E41_13505 [Hydrogenophaga sp. A37]
MLNISSSQPVSWPTAPPVAVAAVTAVPSVGAVQASAREGQADTGRNGQGAQGGLAPGAPKPAGDHASGASTAQAAPLLPRERTEEATPPPTRNNEARAAQRKEDEKNAEELAAQKLQLQEVLSKVWKASAAVVDVVLRREAASVASAQAADGAALAPLAGTPSANDQVITAEEAIPLPANVIDLPVAARRDEEPLMYTEQGTSSWAPLEAGSLLSRHV